MNSTYFTLIPGYGKLEGVTGEGMGDGDQTPYPKVWPSSG